ncbi:MAG: hypothetical protein Sapg2KO_24980 [Saprospiraceae bacterium]
MELIIKNMVCLRCIEAVSQIFNNLGVFAIDVQLGKVQTEKKISPEKIEMLRKHLDDRGFELLDDRQSQIINSIKATIIDQIHHKQQPIEKNYSVLLKEQLNYDYAHLSRLFSAVEGRTIEQYIMSQKIEKVKELLTYNEQTLSEISYDMGYSSTAHLSGQFKKVTGMSPTTFKKLHQKYRSPLDQI